MHIDIVTVFPTMFQGPFQESIVRRAQENKQVKIAIHDLRNWTTDVHRSVDDRPYGGGAGMVMRVDILDRAISALKSTTTSHPARVILLDTKGPFFTQQKAQALSQFEHLILIAGHYEGIDHRVHEHVVDEVISIGPYVLTGGELPAMVVTDAIVRLLPGVINPDSLKEESYEPTSIMLLEQDSSYPLPSVIEYPQYTRPADYKGWKVPEVLLNGNHKDIAAWREAQKKTLLKSPLKEPSSS